MPFKGHTVINFTDPKDEDPNSSDSDFISAEIDEDMHEGSEFYRDDVVYLRVYTSPETPFQTRASHGVPEILNVVIAKTPKTGELVFSNSKEASLPYQVFRYLKMEWMSVYGNDKVMPELNGDKIQFTERVTGILRYSLRPVFTRVKLGVPTGLKFYGDSDVLSDASRDSMPDWMSVAYSDLDRYRSLKLEGNYKQSFFYISISKDRRSNLYDIMTSTEQKTLFNVLSDYYKKDIVDSGYQAYSSSAPVLSSISVDEEIEVKSGKVLILFITEKGTMASVTVTYKEREDEDEDEGEDTDKCGSTVVEAVGEASVQPGKSILVKVYSIVGVTDTNAMPGCGVSRKSYIHSVSKSQDIVVKRGKGSVSYPISGSLKVTSASKVYNPEYTVGSNSFTISKLEGTYVKNVNVQYRTSVSTFSVGVSSWFQETNGAVEFTMGECGYQEFTFSIKLDEGDDDEEEKGELVDKLVAVVDCYGQPAAGASVSISMRADGSFTGGGILGSPGTITFRRLTKGQSYPVKITYRGVVREDSFTA